MIKKVLLLLLLCTFPVYSGYENYEKEEQEAFYDVGVSLAQQNKVSDWNSLKEAAFGIYNDIEEVQELVDLFLIMNRVTINKSTTPVNQLFDIIDQEITQDYDKNKYILIKFIELIGVYQDLFYFFLQISNGLDSPILFLSLVDGSCDTISHEEKLIFQKKIKKFDLIFEKFETILDDIL